MYRMTDLDIRSDYLEILSSVDSLDTEQVINHLIYKFPFLWEKVYKKHSNRITDICRIKKGTFEYIFDDYATLEKKGIVPINSSIESRVIAAFGISNPQKKYRDDYRLRNWIGRTNLLFGNSWDKGHLIAHSIGGSVDGAELNVFQQRRDLNRGWSNDGKQFRKMENYCLKHEGTFCFNRPIYLDQTSKPAFIEFGLLKSSRELWVDIFDNR